MTAEPEPPAPAVVAAAIRAAISGLKAKLRFALIVSGAALFAFVHALSDAGRPVWLVTLIGFFGVILLGMFIALVAFWLHVFGSPGRRNTPDARD